MGSVQTQSYNHTSDLKCIHILSTFFDLSLQLVLFFFCLHLANNLGIRLDELL